MFRRLSSVRLAAGVSAEQTLSCLGLSVQTVGVLQHHCVEQLAEQRQSLGELTECVVATRCMLYERLARNMSACEITCKVTLMRSDLCNVD